MLFRSNQTGKPLDPREIVLKLGTVAALSGEPPISPPVGVDAGITVASDNVFELITSDELWACTTCRACDEVCPAGIEIVDKILDMRRYLSLMEAEFPSELGKAYVSMENSSNPYGMDQNTRGDWTDQLDFEVKRLGEPGVTAEYLMWVGCAGSFDDRNKNVTVSTARLLHKAGIDFAILGSKELCTGDPARRTGNEYVFQGLALQNIETLNGYEVAKKTIITACPHCFNILGNEYSDFGGTYDVVHHSDFLNGLLVAGKLVPSKAVKGKVVYHDSCYLGRYNQVYDSPRQILEAIEGLELTEVPYWNRQKGLCCGAGGAQMFMEEQGPERVNNKRTLQLLDTGATTIASGCPFCMTMLTDGLKDEEKEADIAQRDIAEILADAIELDELEETPIAAQ